MEQCLEYEATAKANYTELREAYEKMDANTQRQHRNLLNEIRMHAAIFNHDRVLF